MVVMVPLRLMLAQAIKPPQGEELWEAAGHLALHCQAGLRYTLCCASLWPEVKACISEKKRKGKIGLGNRLCASVCMWAYVGNGVL